MGKASRRKRERRRLFEIDLPPIITFEVEPGVKSERVFSIAEGELIMAAAAERRVVALLKRRDFAGVDALLTELRRKAGA